MKTNIYFQDLREEKQDEIRDELQGTLKEEIQCIGIAEDTTIEYENVKNEVIDDYINRNNFAFQTSF